jgi:hypothetical protein
VKGTEKKEKTHQRLVNRMTNPNGKSLQSTIDFPDEH